MTAHTAAKSEFHKWIGGLSPEALGDDEKRLLHLYVEHFDELAALGTTGGKRAVRIGTLIATKGSTLPTTLPHITASTAVTDDAICNIVEMKLGPFRGFKKPEPFTFDRQYVFMYGPNGSGKSSFCEGLEYALTGTIAEAEAKRIDVVTYMRNEQASRAADPEVTAKFASGVVAKVIPSNVHRFSFVEKNRIDGFARLSANSEKVQADRISTLFGLEQFTEFVNGFTQTFDHRHLKPLENEYVEAVAKSKALIDQTQSNLTAAKVKGAKTPSEIVALVADVGVAGVSSLEAVRTHLNGVDGDGGQLALLLSKRSGSVPADLDATPLGGAMKFHRQLTGHLTTIREKTEKLQASASELNFKHLYQAVLSISEDLSADKTLCPACKTSLGSTATNPFERAHHELAKMEELARLQDEIGQAWTSVGDGVRALNNQISSINAMRTTLDPSSVPYEPVSQAAPGGESERNTQLLGLSAELRAFESSSATFPALTAAMQSHNAALAIRRAEHALIDGEIIAMNKLVARHADLSARQTSETANIGLLEKQIADQLSLLEPLEKKKTEVQVAVDRNLAYQKAYNSLRLKLVDYHDSLPARLSEGLADQAMKFYNEINHHDPDFHKLAELKLPTAANGKIQIKLRGDDRAHDALQILSDGHIKCLGLALLLAKVVHLDLKFVIYDDIVNAIDDDHRDGIASLLLNDPLLKERQQIITCHGEIFIQKLEAILGASITDTKVRSFRFRPADLANERGILVSGSKSTHYVLLAREAFETNSLRDSATRSRQAVEAITEALWKKLGGIGVLLTVKMRGASARPDLSSVLSGLASAIKSLAFAPGSTLKSDIETLSTKYVNLLLNKGTHHQGDLPEFDRADTKLLVELVERMEAEVVELKFTGTAVAVLKH